MKITIGEANGKPVRIDLDTLLTTRALIQANSGAGKSWLLRVLIEQLFGHVQVIVVDPEGEFATLREKFDFVLVGKEGADTPADVRSAELLAHRLLEIRASAVCDLYEMRPGDRHKWVKLFLESMVNAPKKLWHPCVLIVDEAQLFCPEKGESEAAEAMVSLTTRGRKRGYCAIWATQRLANVNKDATSMLLNRLIGGTFEDVDIKRALDLLSVPPEEKRDVSQTLKTLEPGNFFAFGRAVSKERLLFKVGKVQTSHPQPGSSKHAAEPPPASEKVRDLLPKLQDLPQAAEEKARSIAELTREVRELKRQLNVAQKQQPSEPTIDVKTLEKATKKAVEAAIAERDKQWSEAATDFLAGLTSHSKGLVGQLTAQVEEHFERLFVVKFKAPRAAKVSVDAAISKLSSAGAHTSTESAARPAQRLDTPYENQSRRVQTTAPTNGDAPSDLSAAHIRVLSRLAEILDSTGRDSVPKNQLAAWAEYSPNSGGYNNILGKLRSAGYVDYPQPGMITLTDGGRGLAQPESVPTSTDEMLERAKRILGGSEGRILEVVHGVHPDAIDKVTLAEAAGFTPNSGGYNNYLGHMRTLGFIDYPQKGQVRAADWLFL